MDPCRTHCPGPGPFFPALAYFLPQGTFLPLLRSRELVFPLAGAGLINGVGIIIIYGGHGVAGAES